MKRILVVLTAVALFGLPLTGFGMDLSEIKYGIHGGVMLPQGDLDDDANADMGYVVGGQMVLPTGIMDELMAGLSLDYVMTDGDYDMELSGIELMGLGRYVFDLGNDVKLFGQLGLGVLMWDFEIGSGWNKYEDDGTDFGFAIGGGLSFMENFEAVALYKSFDTGDTDAEYITLTVGYNF